MCWSSLAVYSGNLNALCVYSPERCVVDREEDCAFLDDHFIFSGIDALDGRR